MSVTLQASVDRLEAASRGNTGLSPARGEEPRGPAPQAAAAAGSYAPPPPEILNEATRQAYLDKLVQLNREQHAKDAARYGEELSRLYRQVVEEEGSGTRESNRAFGTLVETYPESYATGMAIANRGLLAAMKQRTVDVEMFRNMLTRKEHFKHIVTDSQIDAYPALCGYLANQYVAEGRKADAEALLEELTKDHAQCYIAIGGFGSKPMLVPVERFAERVRGEARGDRPAGGPPRGNAGG